jgi:hypothetical protein
MHANHVVRLLLAAFCLSGCAENAFSNAERAMDTGVVASDYTASSSSTATGESNAANGAAYWDLRGVIGYDGVAPDPKRSELSVTLYSPQPDVEALCTDSSTFTSTDAGKARTPKWMTHWWDIEWPASVCGGVPTRFTLGIGPYDPQLDPALEARGLSSKGLDSAYLQVTDDGPLYVFGIVTTLQKVSTSSADSGDSGVEPISTVIYTIEGLQLLPL